MMTRYVYYFSFDHKRIGNLFSKEQDAREYAAKWLFYNYKYRTEANVWIPDIVSGKVSEFDFASGGHVHIGSLEVE
ncbi:MAG: hypothetical protein J6V44_15845 [Methanobrevibacter sp.]|nr:hypothetical protein [Methanobrevibacter sp.]MBO7692176.1 hypothetical protein [Methanobrevibacter sp.]